MNSLSKKYENSYLQTLLLCLPAPYLHLDSNCGSQQQVVNIMQQISEVNTPNEDLDDFFREMGIDKKEWTKMEVN